MLNKSLIINNMILKPCISMGTIRQRQNAIKGNQGE